MDQTDPITMTPLPFTISQKMVVRAALLHLGRYRWYFIGAVTFWVVISVTPVLMRIGVWDNASILRYAFQNSVITLALSGALFVFFRWVFFPFVAGRNYRQQKAFSQDMRLSWNAQEFCYATGRSQTFAPFTDLYGYRVADDMVLLYLTNVLYMLVPATVFDDAGQKADLIACLDKAGLRRL